MRRLLLAILLVLAPVSLHAQSAISMAPYQGRTKLTATQTLWVVCGTGNDATPTGSTFGTAFKTIQAAVNAAYSRYNANGQTVLIQVSSTGCTYTGNVVVNGGLPGGGTLQINGSGGPAVIAVPTGNAIQATFGAYLVVTNLTLSSAGGKDLYSTSHSTILMGAGITFGATPAGSQIEAAYNGTVIASAPYTVAAGGVSHLHANTGGIIDLTGQTVTVTGNPAFTSYFCGVGIEGGVYVVGTTFVGAATGPTYVVHYNGSIRANLSTDAQVATFFPGDSPGTSYQGGVFDYVGSSPRRQTRFTGQLANFTATIPAGARISSIVIKDAAANAVTGGLNIGTTPGGSDVLSAFAVPGNSYQDATPLLRVFGDTADQTLYVSAVGSWNSANLTMTIIYDDVRTP